MNESAPLGDTGDFNLAATESWPPLQRADRPDVDCAGGSHVGRVRSINEDHFLIARFGRTLETIHSNIRGERLPRLFEEAGHGMIVADGIGGAPGGEVASELAILTLLDLVYRTPDWIISAHEEQVERVKGRMADRYEKIDEALKEAGERRHGLAGMGTTMTMAANVGTSLVLAHVGDSRAYLYRGGTLHQLTRDHTMAQALVNLGMLRREQEASAKLRRTLTRSLGGGHGAPALADVDRVTLQNEDWVLLCSDGLTNMAPDEAIAGIMARTGSAQSKKDALIEAALQAGGKDNITVVLAHYQFKDAD